MTKSFTDYLENAFRNREVGGDGLVQSPFSQHRIAPITSRATYVQTQLEQRGASELSRLFENISAQGGRYLGEDFGSLQYEFEKLATTISYIKNPDEALAHESKLTDYSIERIELFLEYYFLRFFHQLFVRNPYTREVIINKGIWDKLGILPTQVAALEQKFGQSELRHQMLNAFVTEFFNIDLREEVRSKDTFDQVRFALFQRTLSEKKIERLFFDRVLNKYKLNGTHSLQLSDVAGDTFDEVFNHENKYPSRTKAFFGYPYTDTTYGGTAISALKYVFSFKWFTAVENTVRFLTDYLLTSLPKNICGWIFNRSKYIIRSRKDEPMSWSQGFAYVGLVAGAIGYGIGKVTSEVVKTFTSPWRAAKETYYGIKHAMGTKPDSINPLAGFVAGIRLAIPVAVIAVLALPYALFKGVAKGAAWVFSKAASWLGTKLGLSVGAKAALANVSAPVAVATVLSTPYVLSSTQSIAQSVCDRCMKPQETIATPARARVQAPTPLPVPPPAALITEQIRRSPSQLSSANTGDINTALAAASSTAVVPILSPVPSGEVAGRIDEATPQPANRTSTADRQPPIGALAASREASGMNAPALIPGVVPEDRAQPVVAARLAND